ncbi:MAG: domain S-box protein [Rhizobium sp.]|nr:domain S-box protein [Rhizobium sp.]
MLKELAEVFTCRGRREGDRFLESIVEETPECIKIVAPDGGLVRMNAAGLRMIEADSWTSVAGAPMPDLIAEEHRATWLHNHARVCAGEKVSWQFDIVGLGGTRRNMETHAVPIELDDGRIGQLAITRDITDRRKVEVELQQANDRLDQLVRERTRELEETATRLGESERNFALLVKSVTDYAIFMLDLDGNVVSWNEGAQKIKGYSACEIIGHHFSKFYTEEDKVARLPWNALATAREDGRFENEGWRVRKDGTRFWASVIIDAIRDGDKMIGFAKVTRDITEKRAAEQRLRQAERLEAVGHFTGGAAHDFNNLLMAISGSLEMLRKRLPDDQRSRALLDNAMQGAKRGAALTQRMLAFARRQELKSESIDIGTMLAGMADLLVQSINPSITLDMDVARDLPRVVADQGQLENAVLNLVLNARDAMPLGGNIKVGAHAQSASTDPDVDLAPGKYICIFVKDDGEGMDPDTLSHVREPFYTTKGVGRGTGLGLSMVDGLAAQSGGRLAIESEKGRGTIVTLYLPADHSELASVTDSVETEPEPQLSRKQRVLAVDDDALVLMNTVAMLEDLGHEVVEAHSASRALEIAQSGERFDLVVTDQAMPGMTGVQLAKMLRECSPMLPIILATGYAQLPPGSDATLVRLAKPFTLKQLAESVAAAAHQRHA